MSLSGSSNFVGKLVEGALVVLGYISNTQIEMLLDARVGVKVTSYQFEKCLVLVMSFLFFL